MADEFYAEELRRLCCVRCLNFKNGHEVSSRVGDMSRPFNHLFLMHVYEQGNFSW